MVVDCRPQDRVRPRDQAAFAATRQACAQVGWEYRLLGEPDPVLVVNLRWLGGYRHPRYGHPQTAAALLEVFRPGKGLLAGVCEVGDPIAVLPVAYHLLWQGVLETELTEPLHDAVLVWSAAGSRR